jgi:hypothetical protein
LPEKGQKPRQREKEQDRTFYTAKTSSFIHDSPLSPINIVMPFWKKTQKAPSPEDPTSDADASDTTPEPPTRQRRPIRGWETRRTHDPLVGLIRSRSPPPPPDAMDEPGPRERTNKTLLVECRDRETGEGYVVDVTRKIGKWPRLMRWSVGIPRGRTRIPRSRGKERYDRLRAEEEEQGGMNSEEEGEAVGAGSGDDGEVGGGEETAEAEKARMRVRERAYRGESHGRRRRQI